MGIKDSTRWPGIRTPVEVLTHHWPEWLHSRIEDLGAHHLLVAAPTTPTIPVLMADPGDLVKVQWVCNRGLCELEARVDGCKRGPLPAWVLIATSEPKLHQRRRYARIAVALPLTITVDGSESVHETTTINIGEGGMTCTLGADQHIEPGETAEVIAEIDGTAFSAQAFCLRTTVDSESGISAASFRFEQLDLNQADRLRRYIFHEEMRRRSQGIR